MRMPPYWNETLYLGKYADVADAVSHGYFDNGWMHYRTWGVREGRRDGFELTEEDLAYQYRAKQTYRRTKPSVNLVIAAWSGLRRDDFKPYVEDRTHYLRKQLASLQKYKHRLDQITFVIAENDEEPLEFTQFVDNLPGKIGTACVEVICRRNYGQSYGSYSRVYQNYRDRFDYYIFLEDDYIFVQDRFDEVLVTNYQSMDGAGILCSLVLQDPNSQDLHAGVANGIASSRVLEKIWQRFDCLPHGYWDNAAITEKTKYNTGPQIQFSQAFLEVGTELYDMTYKYCVPFLLVGLNDVKSLVRYVPHRKKMLIAPVQYLAELGF